MADEIIQLIDDDPLTLKILDEQLSGAGYRVFTSLSGRVGLETSKSLNPNMILLDVKMPVMDGFQVLKMLREDEITRNIPVIMLTSVKEKETVIRAMKSGVLDYMVKPYDVNTLIAKIKAGLHYGGMKRQELAEGLSERIYTSHDDESVLISFKSVLSEKSFIQEAKTVFNAVFFKRIMNRDCIFDLRAVMEIETADVKIFEIIIKLFSNRNVLVVAGRHYGSLVANANFDDDIQIFISFGDMELYRLKKKHTKA